MFDTDEIKDSFRFRKHMARFPIRTPTSRVCNLRDEPDEPVTLTLLKVISCDVVLRKMSVETAKTIVKMLLDINDGPVTLQLVKPIQDSIEFIEAEDKGLIQCA
jgi:hypothetical protein